MSWRIVLARSLDFALQVFRCHAIRRILLLLLADLVLLGVLSGPSVQLYCQGIGLDGIIGMSFCIPNMQLPV